MTRSIEEVGRDRKTDAVRVLAAAFHDYPVMRFVLKDAADEYDRRLDALIGYFCERRLTQGWPLLGCFVDGRLVAVAGLNDPRPFVENDAHTRAWSGLRTDIGDAAIERLVWYERESDGDAPSEPHHFLGIIGVLPAHQGEGHARALIEHIKARARGDASSIGVCLSTETADNVPFYEHLGFRARAVRDIAELRYRVMLWEKEP